MIPSFLLEKENTRLNKSGHGKKTTFIDKTINNAASFVKETFNQWIYTSKKGLLQSLDERVKVVFLLLFIIAVSLVHVIYVQIIIAGIIFLSVVLSKINIFHLYKRSLVFSFIFGFIVFLPATLNVFNKGENILGLIKFTRSYQFLTYTIPQEIYITDTGLKTLFRLTFKIINSVSIVLVVSYTTTFEKLIRAMSFFRIPNVFLLILTLSYKYIFILSNVVIETYKGLKMRWWIKKSNIENENIIIGRIGFLFRKSRERYEQVYQAMISRGFNGNVKFCYLKQLYFTDYLYIMVIFIIFCIILILNYTYASTF